MPETSRGTFLRLCGLDVGDWACGLAAPGPGNAEATLEAPEAGSNGEQPEGRLAADIAVDVAEANGRHGCRRCSPGRIAHDPQEDRHQRQPDCPHDEEGSPPVDVSGDVGADEKPAAESDRHSERVDAKGPAAFFGREGAALTRSRGRRLLRLETWERLSKREARYG